MQLWPLDILGEVFKNIPKEAPIIAKVCKRFRNAVDTEAFWALRLKTRFNIKVIPQGTYKSYYKLCFAGMEKLKSPIIPSDQIAEGSFKRYQNGAVSRIAHRIDENLSIELDNNAVRLKKGHEVLALFVLAPSNYSLESLSRDYWTAISDNATYLINLNDKTISHLGASRISVFIRDDYLFTLGNTSLNVHERNTSQVVFSGVVHFNQKRHLYYLDNNEMAFVTQQNELIIISNHYELYKMPCFFEPKARLSQTRLIVNLNDQAHIFDLITRELTRLDLGAFSFKSNLSLAFHKKGILTIYDLSTLKPIASYKIPNNYFILKIDDRFVLLKSSEDQASGRYRFRILFLMEQKEHEFDKKMSYIGSEAFFLLFARLSGSILDIICINALTFELYTPIRSIQNFQFSAATSISSYFRTDIHDYLLIFYEDYKIRVKAVLRSVTDEIKITTYQYHF